MEKGPSKEWLASLLTVQYSFCAISSVVCTCTYVRMLY